MYIKITTANCLFQQDYKTSNSIKISDLNQKTTSTKKLHYYKTHAHYEKHLLFKQKKLLKWILLTSMTSKKKEIEPLQLKLNYLQVVWFAKKVGSPKQINKQKLKKQEVFPKV